MRVVAIRAIDLFGNLRLDLVYGTILDRNSTPAVTQLPN